MEASACIPSPPPQNDRHTLALADLEVEQITQIMSRLMGEVEEDEEEEGMEGGNVPLFSSFPRTVGHFSVR